MIQSDLFNKHATVTVLPLTRALVNALLLLRVTVQPGLANSMQKPSQVRAGVFKSPDGSLLFSAQFDPMRVLPVVA